ncbi:MAG: hypothetical protein BWY04_01468 [candidate division CPR1 bacterium ADurb.Bin160]|uniref:Uncharacterized protein n=1 Tax=candidate division CPR1 bacterium ADurb.Bin160 TaxID=1852826 RepID=A0A1V5ZIC7_9BACT|nr:MAG: hypothetical protein BWY04_01468 [candidate division CPR1 bacterium ADurb.Bin160]
MNVLEPVPLADLKEGELYFEEIELEEDWTHKKFYIITIVKIQKIQSKQLIAFTCSSLKNYNIFSEITDFDTTHTFSSPKYDFFETHIQMKNSTTKYYYYNFDKEWFLKNKEKIMSYMPCSYSRKPFLEIFQEIEKEKI